MLNATRSRGFSLLEVMVAIVVFTIGLLGLGAMIGTSVRSNHVGMLHTQASFLAESIFDRMRANVQGVWADAYDGTWKGTGSPSATCTTASPCNAANLAANDAWTWGREVAQQLPNGSGTIACTPRVAAPSAAILMTVPIYDGTCRISLSWSEVSEDNDGVIPQQLEWVVSP